MPSATEMLAAVDTGDIKAVRMLLEKGADPDARVRGDGTALILASRQGKLAIVEALLEAGAGVDVASRGDGNPLIMAARAGHDDRSEEHTSELQSLMRISYAVFCLKKKKYKPQHNTHMRIQTQRGHTPK